MNRVVRQPQNYDPLRDTERKVMAEQQFAEAGREATLPQQRGAEPQMQTPEPADMNPVDKYEADRAARIQELDAQVDSGKINDHERYYQMQRFETEGINQHASSADRAAALESLDKPGDRANLDTGIDQAPDLARKQNDREL